MRSIFRKTIFIFFILISALTLYACGMQGQSVYTGSGSLQEDPSMPFSELEKTGELELSYASEFTVEEYGKLKLIRINDGDNLLVVPETEQIPSDIPDDITLIRQPIGKAYLVSSSAMDPVIASDALGCLKFSGTKQSDWYLPEAVQAMESGRVLYAGKYSAPDYELLVSGGCDLAIENTMIYHSPEVKEKLEELGIPVVVEHSSREKHPLGRLEWIKLYGILFDKEAEANRCFDSQLESIRPVMDRPGSGVKAAFFYVNSMGAVNVRKPGDYISEMIEMAGGEYALAGIAPETDNALSTMNMQMEDFFLAAKDADVLIYNSTVDAPLGSIDELVEKNELFAQFAAVKSGRVYCTGRNFFQESTKAAQFIADLSAVFEGDAAPEELNFLVKLE